MVGVNKHLWQRLSDLAEGEVSKLLRRLPEPVRREVKDVPIVFEPRPSEAVLREGFEPDLLGIFEGDAYDEDGFRPIPRRIVLYLVNLWDEAGEDAATYRDEVRRTLLHEIGHYLGLEEDDLELRGLE